MCYTAGSDLKPIGNITVDLCYKVDTVAEDIDRLVGLQ